MRCSRSSFGLPISHVVHCRPRCDLCARSHQPTGTMRRAYNTVQIELIDDPYYCSICCAHHRNPMLCKTSPCRAWASPGRVQLIDRPATLPRAPCMTQMDKLSSWHSWPFTALVSLGKHISILYPLILDHLASHAGQKDVATNTWRSPKKTNVVAWPCCVQRETKL